MILFPVFLVLSTATLISAQYTGYSLTSSGDPGSVVYSTSSTPANVSADPAPDVFLNATVHVGEIDISVSNLTAKLNLDAQVLQLLSFNAGVDLSIDRVSLLLADVDASVQLEVRLENLVRMINDTLDSLDLNPILANVGQAVGDIANGTVGGLVGEAIPSIAPRSFELENNILYSVNDYSGNTHTNRILAQDGSIVDQSLDNDGNVYSQQVVGSYERDMAFVEDNEGKIVNGQAVRELEYVYKPFDGLSAVCAIYVDAAGAVVGTQVLSESRGGGSSTMGADL